jgi:hypothetical protein
MIGFLFQSHECSDYKEKKFSVVNFATNCFNKSVFTTEDEKNEKNPGI